LLTSILKEYAMKIDLLPTAPRMLKLHEAAMPQKDHFCGAFCASLAVTVIAERAIDQDAVAQAAGTLLPAGPPLASDRAPGQASRRDYAFDPPVISDPALSGTSAAGVCRAVDMLSGGLATALAVRGPWQAGSFRRLLDTAMSAQTVLILNPNTRDWWGTHPAPAAVLGYLDGEDTEPPASDWDVGHFVCAVGRLCGRYRELCLIADTYPSLGWGGLYPQPYDRVADGLTRRDLPTSGGAILVTEAAAAEDIGHQLVAGGLELGVWDNGSGDASASVSATPDRAS
jgi:hypothetical protein